MIRFKSKVPALIRLAHEEIAISLDAVLLESVGQFRGFTRKVEGVCGGDSVANSVA